MVGAEGIVGVTPSARLFPAGPGRRQPRRPRRRRSVIGSWLSISYVMFASSRRLLLPLYAAESSQETHLTHLKLRTTMSTYIHIGRLSSYSLRFLSCEPIDISGRLF